jgi:hypothetical protein
MNRHTFVFWNPHAPPLKLADIKTAIGYENTKETFDKLLRQEVVPEANRV